MLDLDLLDAAALRLAMQLSAPRPEPRDSGHAVWHTCAATVEALAEQHPADSIEGRTLRAAYLALLRHEPTAYGMDGPVVYEMAAERLDDELARRGLGYETQEDSAYHRRAA